MANNNNISIKSGTTVLVTGATGFTGSNLVKKLCSAGLHVKAIARSSSKVEHLKDLDIQWYRGDVFDEYTVNQAIKDAEYVFHVAAAFREAKYGDDFYHKVHVISTQLLAKAALNNPGFKRFIHISTMGVHGHIENPPANEESPFSPGDIYQHTKAEAELWIRDFAVTNHLPLTVIRPTGIYGPGDHRLFKIFKMAAGPVFPILGSGKCLYHLIHVDDLTNIMLLAATHPAAAGQVFLAGNDQPIPLEQMVSIIAKTIGRKPKVIRLPVWPFFLIGDICEAVCKPFGIEPPIYRRRVAFFTKDRAFDTSKMRSMLGYNCIYSNETGLQQTAQWYLENNWLKQ
ncbi:MAG: NAD-dependent epimerase/dehydratase family protein [Kiritimatiellae bacterium]|nr:NAD-dependent epimerase/dehydratase family protein [Kiritimatiellia bacterium]MDD5522647.1 NAD-dependent epimerase/dehydratase family protein [Kiritimatiellia bacterium]